MKSEIRTDLGPEPVQNISARNPEFGHDIFKAEMELQQGILSPKLSLEQPMVWLLNPTPKPDSNPNTCPQLKPQGKSLQCWCFGP